MFLSRPDLLKEIRSGKLRFDPAISIDRIEQVSIDLLLGHEFVCFKEKSTSFISAVHLDDSIWDSLDIWERTEGDSYLLKPKHFVLGQTLEKVSIPNHLVGLIEGRSRYARLGLTTHLTAPKIDPGFSGQITLEIANLGSLPIRLRSGVDSIAQLMLLPVSTPLKKEEAYGTSPSHMFQHQVGPIPRGRAGSRAPAARPRKR